MYNQVVLMGVLDSDPIEVADPSGSLTHKIFVKVDKEEDPIAVYIWSGVADAMAQKYPVGTILGIKGSLKLHRGQLIVAGERISLVSEKED